MIKHLKTDHPDNKLFECDSCDYKCNMKGNMKVHKAAKHEGTLLNCDKCDYKTKWKPRFLEHIRVSHGNFQRKSKHKEV